MDSAITTELLLTLCIIAIVIVCNKYCLDLVRFTKKIPRLLMYISWTMTIKTILMLKLETDV